MSGSTIGGVVGGVIGIFLAPYTGGASIQWGFMIGSAIGGYVDPTVVKGPKLTDPQKQTSSEGVPRAIVYGTAAVMGNVIMCQSVPTEHKHEDNGKGGSTVQETYTYTRTCAIRICEAAPLGGEMRLRRCWVNGKLAYDATGSGTIDADSAKFLQGMTFYSGSETQLPDANLEALPESDGGGVGNVCAHRGSCYAVLKDVDVTQTGGALPQFRWEVVSHGTEDYALLNPNWIATNGNGGFLRSNGTDWTTESLISTSATGNNLRYCNGRLLCIDNGSKNYSDDKGDNWSATTITSGTIPDSATPSTSVHGNDFWVLDRPWKGDGASLSPVASIGVLTPPAFGVGFGVCGSVSGNVYVSTNEFSTSSFTDTPLTDDVTVAVSNGSRVLLGQENGGNVCYTDNGSAFSSAYTLSGWNGNLAGGAAEGDVFVLFTKFNTDTGAVLWVSTDNAVTFTLVTLPERLYCYDVQIGGGLIVAVGELNKDAGTPRIWTAPLSDPLTWTQRNSNFGSVDKITGVAYMPCDGYAIPDSPNWYVHRDGTLCSVGAHYVSPDNPALSDVVADLCERGGVTDYDVTALASDIVRGYPITQPTDAAGAINVLQQVYFFDMPEWGNSGDTYTKIRAVKRGGASVLNLSDDDLVDVDSDEDTRAQSVEFPRKLNLVFLDPDANYESAKETAERVSENVKAISEATVSTAVVFTRAEAAPRADIMLRVAWEEAAGTSMVTVPEEFTQYTPSDIVTRNGKRYRLDKANTTDGQTEWTLTRDRASAYSSNATGSTVVALPPATSSIRGRTMFQAMNLSSLRSSDNVPGMYLAACGLLPGWNGADIFLSVDGGLTETNVMTIIDPATMGWLTADLDSGDVLAVNLYSDDELDDATTDQIAAGINACAVLTDGVAEIIQFADATDTGVRTFDLETLTRGELGTTETDHFTDDDFVLLDSSVVFLPIDASLAGKTLIFRAVSRGTVAAKNPTYSVVFDPPTFVIDGGGA